MSMAILNADCMFLALNYDYFERPASVRYPPIRDESIPLNRQGVPVLAQRYAPRIKTEKDSRLGTPVAAQEWVRYGTVVAGHPKLMRGSYSRKSVPGPLAYFCCADSYWR